MSVTEGVPEILSLHVEDVNRALKNVKPSTFEPDVKDNKEADEARLKGNEFFGNEEYFAAVEMYCESIALAEPGSVSMALAYGNRSASLFEMEYYKACLIDIERALANNCPKNNKAKLHRRRDAAKNIIDCEPVKRPPPEIPVDKRNPKIECAADCVDIREFEGMGRGIVATRDIQLGEVLAVEKPYAVLLYFQTRYHCHECGEFCLYTIPCDGCTTAMFCGEQCKEIAWHKYHQHECKILSSFTLNEKLLMKSSLKVVLSIKSYQNLFKSDQGSPYRSDRPDEILKLWCNYAKQKKPIQESTASFVARLYMTLKEHTSFFDNFQSSRDHDIFKGLMLYLMHVSRGTEVKLFSRADTLEPHPETVGTKIQAFTSLLNHSCVPNSAIGLHWCESVLVATENIKKGEQIFIAYNGSYDDLPTSERQLKLRGTYCFTCQCEACLGGWRTGGNLKVSNLARHVELLKLEKNLETYRPQELKLELIRLSFAEWVKPSKEHALYTNIVLSAIPKLVECFNL